MPLRILVTGAGGFIGGAAVRAALGRGHRVTRLVRTAPASAAAGQETVVADLSAAGPLAQAIAGHDVVIHCAASLAGGAPEQARDTLAATAHLLAAMRDAGVGRLVLVSSFAVYDHRALPVGARLDETSPLEADAAARGPYVEAKLAQEQLVRAAAGLDWRIVRPGLVFGPGRGWFYHLGMPAPGGVWLALSGQAELPLTHVDNCAGAVVAAAETAASGVVANVVDDVRPTRLAYMRALAAATAPGTRVVDVPWTLLAAGGRMANLMGLTPGMLHPARLAARCKPLTYDNAVAKTALGWRPALPMDVALETLS